MLFFTAGSFGAPMFDGANRLGRVDSQVGRDSTACAMAPAVRVRWKCRRDAAGFVTDYCTSHALADQLDAIRITVGAYSSFAGIDEHKGAMLTLRTLARRPCGLHHRSLISV